jgi:hypothetical protein
MRDFDRNAGALELPRAAAAFLTAIPRPAASDVADSTGAAARMSTAGSARECRRRTATARRALS